MRLAVALIALIISLVTALVVFQKNPKSATNVYFALLVSLIGVYPVFNYLAINAATSEDALFWAKMILVVSIPEGSLLLFFAKVFPDVKFIFNKRLQLFLLAWVLLDIVLATQGLIFEKVNVVNGVVNIQPGKLVPAFGLLHVSTIIAGLMVLLRKYRRARGSAHKQLAFIFYGTLISFSLTFLITFVLPLLLKSTILLAISPLFLALAVVAVAYAIIRHSLFDIRAAIARSVGFVLSLGFIGLLYGAAAFSVLTVMSSNSLSSASERGVYIGLALLTAFVYPYAKSFFERITTKLFFKDVYDTQDFLNELNEVLVQKIVLEPLLTSSAKIISENLKSSHVSFTIRKTAYSPVRIIGDNVKLMANDHDLLNEYAADITHKVIVRELLEDEGRAAARFLAKKDIDILVRLVPNLDYPIEGVGYLALGPKRNGEPYSSKDQEILEIIANELVIAIENGLRFEEIDAFNSTLQDKIDIATLQLKRTNEKLKALDETKDEFISMASHQLRTPLTSVKGYVSMVLEGDAGELNPTQRKLLEQSFASSQRMVYLIADLLNLSRLRTGKFVIEAKPTNLAEVIESEVDQLKASAAGRNLTLTYEKPKVFSSLMLDETKIRQVIMNFADNAIYYTPSGGKINIQLRETKDSVEFTVNDNGIGIPADEQHHLFNKFYRAKNAQKARPDGTGLGLFMAKKVIIAQGGAIVFHSKEGKGSTFGFTFSKQKLKVAEPVQPRLAKT
jgi:signal transduction histidine kinase